MKFPWLARRWKFLGRQWTVRTKPNLRSEDGESMDGECDPTATPNPVIYMNADSTDENAIITWFHEIIHPHDQVLPPALVKAHRDGDPSCAYSHIGEILFALWRDNTAQILKLAIWMQVKYGHKPIRHVVSAVTRLFRRQAR